MGNYENAEGILDRYSKGKISATAAQNELKKFGYGAKLRGKSNVIPVYSLDGGDGFDVELARGGDVVAEDTVTIGQDFTPSKNMAEAQAKLDTGVKDLRADRKAQFDKMTEQLTSGAVKDMELEEQENFVALYKLLKQHHSFAEGGAVPMKEQMSMFEDGGLMDEGGSIDPVSGNDVPPGSTQEEVRDDIPAQLSEGEFVFPADVVRFIGLSNLMSMRQEAKMGLKQMEAMGQMGNSDEATMPDDLPFDLNDLDIDDEDEYNGRQEFAVGGMPDPATGVYFTPPVQQGTTGVTAPQPLQAASSQYVAPQQQAVPTTTTETPDFKTFIQPPAGMAPELREYTNSKTGEKITITFINNQPTSDIPEGYVPSSEYVAPDKVTTDSARVTTSVPNFMDEGEGYQEPDNRPYGGFTNSRDSKAYSSMNSKLGRLQLASFSPFAALGTAVAGKATPNQIATGMAQGRKAALATLGYESYGDEDVPVSDLDYIADVMERSAEIVNKAPSISAEKAAEEANRRATKARETRDRVNREKEAALAAVQTGKDARIKGYEDSGGETSSPGGGYSGYSSGAAQESTGGKGSQSAGSGWGGMAKGGSVSKQMKRSGLASK